MATNNKPEITGWVGWIYFAGFLMIVSGILQMISGLTALLNDKFYVATAQNLLAFDITTWGWVHLLFGLFVVLAGTAVIGGHVWGRLVAIVLAMLGIIAQFAFLSAYPFWAILMIIVNFLVLYALTVHGEEVEV